jgi:hypothetical protein
MHIKRPKPKATPKAKTTKDEDGEDGDGGLGFLAAEAPKRLAQEDGEEIVGSEAMARPYETLVEELKAALLAQDEYIEELKKRVTEDGGVQDMLGYVAQTYREHRDALTLFSESVRSLRDLEVKQLKGEIEALQVQVEVLKKEVKIYHEAFERVDKIRDTK